MKLVNKPVEDLDYVGIYAEKLRRDSSLFKQQKELIDSQIDSSATLFRNRFGNGEEFKKRAREYLKRVGLL